MNLLPIICVLAFWISFLNLQALETPPILNCATNPPDYSKLTFSEADVATKAEEQSILGTRIKRICPEYITNLVFQLRSGSLNESNKVLTVYLLGMLHPDDSNSIEALIECIELRATVFDPKTAIVRWGYYPAQEALIGIRKPALNPVIAHLHSETNSLRRHLMCGVVRHVEGWKSGMEHLKKLAAAESDAERRKNLELSVEALEKLPH